MSKRFPTINTQLSNKYDTVIEPTEDAVTSEPFEVRPRTAYTLVATNMEGAAEVEYIKLEIFDTTTKEWQDFTKSGEALKLHINKTVAALPYLACILRFVKTATSVPVGLSINRH